MKKLFIIITMLAASAAMFAEIKSMKYVYNGNKCTVWFTDSRPYKYFSLAEIADYDCNPYISDKNYTYELVGCATYNIEDGLFVKLLQDLCSKYNYVTVAVDDCDECVMEAFMLNAYDEICIREWQMAPTK